MFAVAIWDTRRSRLILCRDRLGKSPLYIAQEPGRPLFASEIKEAILVDETLSKDLNFSAFNEDLALGYVPGPLTLLKGIEKVLPGHYVVCERGQVSTRRYWRSIRAR